LSTSPVVVPVTKPSTFGFKSLGHFFATAISDLKIATRYLETKILPETQSVLKEVETVTADVAVFVPQANTALVIERAVDAAAGELLAAFSAVDVAEGSSLVNVSFDAAVVIAFKAFIADQKSALLALGYKL
jgi:phenylalanyl-tRNA synthetase beta subunit